MSSTCPFEGGLKSVKECGWRDGMKQMGREGSVACVLALP